MQESCFWSLILPLDKLHSESSKIGGQKKHAMDAFHHSDAAKKATQKQSDTTHTIEDIV